MNQLSLASQNDILNLNFVKDIEVIFEIAGRNGPKTAIYHFVS